MFQSKLKAQLAQDQKIAEAFKTKLLEAAETDRKQKEE